MSTGPRRHAPAGRHRGRIALVVTIAALLPLALLAGYLAGTLLREADHVEYLGLINGPSPAGPAVDRAREAAQDTVAAELTEVGRDFTADLRRENDGCEPGQTDEEPRDDFEWRCVISGTALFGFSGDFQPTMLRFGKRLAAKNWYSDRDLQYTLEDYGWRSTVDALPYVLYERDGTQLVLNFVEADSHRPLAELEGWAEGADAAEQLLVHDDYVLIVDYYREYYRR